MLRTYIICIILLSTCARTENKKSVPFMNHYSPDDPNIQYFGRIDFSTPDKPLLGSAGATFVFTMEGKSCILELENQYPEPSHNYISIEIDGVYRGRIKVEKSKIRYNIADNLSRGKHSIEIVKATESAIGWIALKGIECTALLPLKEPPVRSIEFIGNSITCGAQVGEPGMPCDSGEWHDHNNAYLGYATQLAKSLNARWVLSAISGKGLTRNWNDEGPGVPYFYDRLFLDNDTTRIWTAELFRPDLLIICLGTNDNSAGDGSYDRKPLEGGSFVQAYTKLVIRMHRKHPQAVICLLNSPVFGPEDTEIFNIYLEKTISTAKDFVGDIPIYRYSWSKQYSHGCTGHPGIDDSRKMAEELKPFIEGIMNW